MDRNGRRRILLRLGSVRLGIKGDCSFVDNKEGISDGRTDGSSEGPAADGSEEGASESSGAMGLSKGRP